MPCTVFSTKNGLRMFYAEVEAKYRNPFTGAPHICPRCDSIWKHLSPQQECRPMEGQLRVFARIVYRIVPIMFDPLRFLTLEMSQGLGEGLTHICQRRHSEDVFSAPVSREARIRVEHRSRHPILHHSRRGRALLLQPRTVAPVFLEQTHPNVRIVVYRVLGRMWTRSKGQRM